MAKKKDDTPSLEAEKFENTPSTLDSLTHKEMEMLYRESTETVRFAKNLQWKTLGATLLIFGGMIGITKIIDADRIFGKLMSLSVILFSVAAIFLMITFQMWQHTESKKIEVISRKYSTLFTKIRRLKSKREANIQRYIMLGFLIVAVVLGAFVTNRGIALIIG